MPGITVTVARPEERPLLENLFQLYVHDFSEFWQGQDRGELEPDGRFEPYPLEDYWNGEDRVPLLLRREGHLAGFALINRHFHSGRTGDWSMAEFFIVRKHRRGGLGLAAARAIFALYPGRWEAAVVRANLPALAFWRKVANGCGAAEEIDVRTDDWNGPILRFVAGI